MGNRRNKYIGGWSGALLAGPWSAYSAFTTVKDLPADAGWVARMLADPPVYLPWLLFAASVVFLAWVFWKRDDGPAEPGADSPQTATTYGANSPALSGDMRGATFNIHSAPAAVQQPRDPHGRPPHAPEDRPKRSMRISQDWRRASSGLPPREPDFKMSQVVAMLRERRGPVPSGITRRREFWRQIGLEIADKVVLREMLVWGRIGDRAIQQIDYANLEGATFNAQAHTVSFLSAYAMERTVYQDVGFNREQVMEAWPRQ